MADQKRDIVDDIAARLRELLERLFNPDKARQKPARVPVPVRVRPDNPHEHNHDPYNRH